MQTDLHARNPKLSNKGTTHIYEFVTNHMRIFEM